MDDDAWMVRAVDAWMARGWRVDGACMACGWEDGSWMARGSSRSCAFDFLLRTTAAYRHLHVMVNIAAVYLFNVFFVYPSERNLSSCVC